MKVRDLGILSTEDVKTLKTRVAGAADKLTDTGDEALYELIDEIIRIYCFDRYISITDRLEIRQMIFASLRGYDVLQPLLDDSDVTEIMVIGPEKIFYEKDGRIRRYEKCFDSSEKLDNIIQKIAAGANRAVNEANPIVDARLPDGSRVNAVLFPVSIFGSALTIRKFPHEVMTMERLIELGALTSEAAEFLKNLVIAGYNIFVSGGTGAGKTTFLNALSGYIPADERIVTIEDSAELQLGRIPNLVSLEVRRANVEGRNEITVRDLIKTSLRMRPDRIVVGEVRDAACIDMLQSLNTGHSGMSTGHANSTSDMLSRLETMTLLGTDIPLNAVRRQIASAIDIIIHLGRFRDKSRKVVEITEVAGFENNEIVLNRLFEFVEEGEKEGRVIGQLKATGNQIVRTAKLRAAGL